MGISVFQQQRIAMVDGQLRTNKIIDPQVIDLFLKTPRELFAVQGRETSAYVDEDMALGHGRTLIEPLVAARMLQSAQVDAGQTALLIAGANGYLARLLCDLGVSVTVVEPIEELASQGRENVKEATWIQCTFDELPEGPFDRIFVGGSLVEIPHSWSTLLSEGGRILTPVSGQTGNDGKLVAAHRSGSKLSEQVLANAAVPTLPEFVPQPQFEL